MQGLLGRHLPGPRWWTGSGTGKPVVKGEHGGWCRLLEGVFKASHICQDWKGNPGRLLPPGFADEV